MFAQLKKLSLESLGYGFSRAVSQSISIFLVPMYTRLFLPEEYGVIDVIKTITAVLMGVLILGTDTALSLHYFDDESTSRRQAIATAAWCTRLSVTFLVLGLLFVNAGTISALFFGDAAYAQYLLLVILTLPFTLSLHLFSHLLRLHFALWKYNVVSVGLVALTVIMNLLLVVYLKAGISGVFWADLLTGVVMSLVGFAFTRTDFSFSWSRVQTGALLATGLPMVPASLGVLVLSSVDRLFLLRYTSLCEVGLYAVGVKLSSLIGLEVGAFQTAWYPFALSIAQERGAKEIYARVLRYYLLLTMAIALFLSCYSREVLVLFTAPTYVQAYKVVGILVCATAASQAYYIASIGLALTKNTRHLAWTTGAAVGTTVLLDFVLVPWWGMIGAALAPLLGYLVSTLLAYCIAQRYYSIPFEWNKIGKIGFISLSLIVVGANISTGAMWLDIVLKALVTFVVFPGSLYFFGCIERAEVEVLKELVGGIKSRLATSLSG